MAFSEHNSSLTLEGLQTKPEGQYLERKGRATKPAKIANELIGMLNADGGVLAYGIADDGAIEDLNALSSTELDACRKIVHDLIRPPANIELEEIYLSDGQLIFLFHVEPNHERLFAREGSEAVYRRVADNNKGPLKRDAVKNLEYNKAIRSYEEELREDFDPSDLDSAICEEYCRAMNYTDGFEKLAIKRNLAQFKDNALIYKNSAILLFSKDPSQYISNAAVRYVRYRGTELQPGKQFNVVKDQRFELCLPKLIRQLEAFVEASLRDYYFLNMKNGRFERVPEFPREAWLEGIVNAVCHRSYNIQGNCIYIKHFDDRLEISNSGPLPAQVTVDNISQERYSRNPRITRVLAEMGYVRELNEGVPRIFNAMKQSMLAAPQYKDVENTVTLTLRNKVTDHKKTIHADTLKQIEVSWTNLSSRQQKMIDMLLQKQELTIGQMIDTLGISDQAVRHNLKKLEGLEIIERVSKKIRDSQAFYRFKNK